MALKRMGIVDNYEVLTFFSLIFLSIVKYFIEFLCKTIQSLFI